MIKGRIMAAVFIAVGVLIAAMIYYFLFLTYKQFDFSPNEFKKCITSADCTIDYQPFCADCGHWNGAKLAVNKYWFEKNLKNRNCTGVVVAPAFSKDWRCSKNKVACIIGQCMLV